MPPSPAGRDKSMNPEQYAPALVLHLLGIAPAAPELVKKWTAQLPRDLEKRNWLALGELTGGGSANHLWMLGAAALLLGIEGAVEFWMLLLGYQIGINLPLSPDAAVLGCWGLSEPYAAEYQAYRDGPAAVVRLWAARNQHAGLRQRCQQYFDIEAAMLALFAIGRPDPEARRGGHGMQYSGCEVACVGERTNGRIVSQLGPILALLISWPDVQIAPAVGADWSVAVVQQARGVLVSDATARACRAWIESPSEATLKPLAAALEGVHLREGAEQHLWVYQTGRAAWKDRKTNGNTPPGLATWMPNDGPARVLFPWNLGRNAKAEGGACRAVKEGAGWVLVATGDPTIGEQRLELPAGEPLLKLTMGENGLEVEA